MLAECFGNQTRDMSTVSNQTQKRKFYKEYFYMTRSNILRTSGCFHGRFPLSTSSCTHAISPINRPTWVALGTFIGGCFNKKNKKKHLPTHHQYFPFMFCIFANECNLLNWRLTWKFEWARGFSLIPFMRQKKNHWYSLNLSERFANKTVDMGTVPNHTQSNKFYSESLYLRSSNALWNRGCLAEHYNVNFFKSRVNFYLFLISS